MNLEQTVEAAKAAVDAQSAKVSESAQALVEAAGQALVEFATQEVKGLVNDDHERTAKYQAEGQLGQFKSEVLSLISGLPAEVDVVFAGGKHLVYAYQLSMEAFSALGVSGDKKAVVRAGCNLALAKVNYLVKDWYPHNQKIALARSSNLDFPASFQNAIKAEYQVYNVQQLELERVTRLLSAAEADLSKSNAALAWDNA